MKRAFLFSGVSETMFMKATGNEKVLEMQRIDGRYACTEQMPKDLKFCMDNKTTRERSFFMQTLIKYLKK